jgi:hypothetical protein
MRWTPKTGQGPKVDCGCPKERAWQESGKQYTGAFKAKLALEAIKGQRTVQEFCHGRLWLTADVCSANESLPAIVEKSTVSRYFYNHRTLREREAAGCLRTPKCLMAR